MIEYAIKLDFSTTNNEAEYEALIAGLGLAKALRVQCLKICGVSKLVVSQLNGEYEAHEETMQRYLRMVKEQMTQFEECQVDYIPRGENVKVDALSKIASSEIENYVGSVYFQVFKTPSIQAKLVAPISLRTCWMDPIMNYLHN